jgi:PAS domain S-box-containing protein
MPNRHRSEPAPGRAGRAARAASVPSRDETDEALTDAAALWNAVCRTSGEFIVVVDRAGTMRFCNEVGDGYTEEQVRGHSIFEFSLPEATQELKRKLQEVFDTGSGRTLETQARGGDGELIYFSVRLGPILHEGRTKAVVICCENILPLKTSEQTLKSERNVLRRMLEIQERERQLISYEIHDGLAQYLAGALMHLEAFRHAYRVGPDAREFAEGIRLMRTAAEEARRLIGGLRPPALDELGIVDALESLVADARTEIPSVTFSHSLPASRLPPGLETTIFRVVQESLSNARRHSGAQAASVDVARVGGAVRIVVRDEGGGFDPARVPEDRFGLEGIRQRCRLFGAEPRIESAPGRGTTIAALLPIPPDAAD